MNGVFVGHWHHRVGKDELHYADSWIAHSQGRPLSLSLPFTPGNTVLRAEQVNYFFENLLPDSRDIRTRLAQRFQCASDEPFDLLAEIGRDCIGAIQLLPLDEEPQNLKQICFETLSEDRLFETLYSSYTSRTGLEASLGDELRISLAGAQEKTALLRHKNAWCLPSGATPTTHIFKFPLGLVGNLKLDMQHSVENEWLCSKIFQAFGIPCANCEIGYFNGLSTLIVERFDRKIAQDQTWIMRLPQEDLCQALGLSPLKKYQTDGGPGINAIMNVLGQSAEARKDRENFFKAQLVFYLLIASDGHAKNFSIRHLERDHFVMTPLYDVLSMHPIIGKRQNQIPRQKAKLAMAIQGSKNYYFVDSIKRRHFVTQAGKVGFSSAEASAIINGILEQVDDVITMLESQFSEKVPERMVEAIFSGMKKQRDLLK